MKHQGGKYIGIEYTISRSQDFGYAFRCSECDDTRDEFKTEDEAHRAAFEHISRYANRKLVERHG